MLKVMPRLALSFVFAILVLLAIQHFYGFVSNELNFVFFVGLFVATFVFFTKMSSKKS
jgi:hypothetical protein